MSRIWFRLALPLSFCVPITHAVAQLRAQTEARFHTKILSTDTLEFSAPTISPDGKWVVYGLLEVGRSNLWVVPATGGSPRRLTNGDHVDANPQWFPNGERIAFKSDRTKSLMVLDFDKANGSAVGMPRRVTLEEVNGYAIAPDGSRIAYFTGRLPDGNLLKQVPAAGGKATTIAEVDAELARPANLQFSPDGGWVYFAAVNDAKRVSSLYRVVASGGKPQPVNPNLTFPTNALNVFPIVGEQKVIVLERVPRRGAVLTFAGDTVSTFNLRQSTGDIGRSPADTKTYPIVYTNSVAPTRLVGMDGRARTIGKITDWESPSAWSGDGKRLLVTLDSGTFAIMNADGTGRSVERIAAKNLSIPSSKLWSVTPDLRYLFVAQGSGRAGATLSLYIYDRQTKTAREVTQRAERTGFTPANGNSFGTNHGEFVYLEGSGDRVEIRGVKPTGETRVIRSLPRDMLGKAELAIDGDKVAYQTLTTDSASLFAITELNGEPKKLMTIRGRFEELAWSPDTKTIAAVASTGKSAETPTLELMFVPVATPSQSRSIPLGEDGYEAVWSPDSRAVFFLKAAKGWTQTSVWRYPLRADEPARNITQNETSFFSFYQLSPDGSAIALSAEQKRGSSIWRIELDQAAAAYRDAKAKATQAGKP